MGFEIPMELSIPLEFCSNCKRKFVEGDQISVVMTPGDGLLGAPLVDGIEMMSARTLCAACAATAEDTETTQEPQPVEWSVPEDCGCPSPHYDMPSDECCSFTSCCCHLALDGDRDSQEAQYAAWKRLRGR